MLRSGEAYLEGIRDGRAVYIGKERVADVTDHPAFANAARMYAAMYDLKRADDMRDVLWVEDGGERIPAYFLKPRDRRDLEIRTAAHRAIAAFSHGLLGRSPDHVASSITGLAMGSAVFDRDGGGFSERIEAYYEHARTRDLYLAYAILPPQGARKPELYQSADRSPPTLRVTAEDSEGVVLNGMKMLATGAVFADELWIGNIIPLAPSQVKESVTCAVPVNAPGVALWARKPFGAAQGIEFHNPLSHRFDESDSMIVFKDVHVPGSASSSTTTRRSRATSTSGRRRITCRTTSRTCALRPSSGCWSGSPRRSPGRTARATSRRCARSWPTSLRWRRPMAA